MSKRSVVTTKLLFALVSILGSSLCYVARYNWTVQARFSLILNGYPFAETVAPAKWQNIPADFPGGFGGSELVRYRGRYVGYLDGSACFVPVEIGVGAWQHDIASQTRVVWIILILEVVFGTVGLVLTIGLLRTLWMWRRH